MTELLQDAISSFDDLADDLEGLPDSLELQLCIEDPEVIQALVERSGRERRQFALDALRIGVLALRHAGQRLDGDTIQRESSRLVEKLQSALEQHATVSHERMNGALSTYFDPTNGHFTERVRLLVGNDGELCQLLKAQLDGENSHLARTLLAHVGSESPLMKILDPAQSQGLLSALRETVDGQLTKQRDQVLREFSLDNKEGALCRLVAQLTANHGDLSKELQTKIDSLTKEFSLNEEGSALNRLMSNVVNAQRTISSEFSLDNEQSAFSRLRVMLETTQGAIHSSLTLDDDASPLARLKREIMNILEAHVKTNAAFQEHVKETLAQLNQRKKSEARSPAHGNSFQSAVFEFVYEQAQGRGDIAEFTGDFPGAHKFCKTGDAVVELGPDSAAPGTRIVFEAKDDKQCNLRAALDEIERARTNRESQVGVFVFAKNSAPSNQRPLDRLRNDVMVIWDAEDPATDAYLIAAFEIARACCLEFRKATDSNQADFEAINAAINDIESRANNMEKIRKSAETIKSSSGNILKRVGIDQKALHKQVAVLRKTLDDLREIAPGTDFHGT